MDNQKEKVKGWQWIVAFVMWNAMIAAIVVPMFQQQHKNYDVLTKEVRFLENKNYQETKKELALLKEARDVLRECEAVYKAQQSKE